MNLFLFILSFAPPSTLSDGRFRYRLPAPRRDKRGTRTTGADGDSSPNDDTAYSMVRKVGSRYCFSSPLSRSFLPLFHAFVPIASYLPGIRLTFDSAPPLLTCSVIFVPTLIKLYAMRPPRRSLCRS